MIAPMIVWCAQEIAAAQTTISSLPAAGNLGQAFPGC
jgi:hypothetical protein